MRKEDTYKEPELRSEEVQDIMGVIPPWIERWGVTLLFVIVIILLVCTFFFKFPDVISARMTLTGSTPALPIVSRSDGRIDTLCVVDCQEVQKDHLLAIINNSASWKDVFFLKDILEKCGDEPEVLMDSIYERSDLFLGEVQSSYMAFLSNLYGYINYKRLDYYPQKKAAIESRVNQYLEYEQSLMRQNEIAKQQFQIASTSYQRDSSLYVKGYTSEAEHEKSRTSFLNTKAALESSNSTIEQLIIQIGQLQENLLDLSLEREEREAVLYQAYYSGLNQLRNAIGSWELAYCLISPIKGRVTITSFWSSNQTVMAGENVFLVVPEQEDRMIGKAVLPVARSGKVKIGQRVIVHFDNYPDTEFGVVNGIVSGMSLAPFDSNYMVDITFPEGLSTTYHKTLPLMHEMNATVNIITEDMRLIERIILPIKDIIRND